MTTRTKNQIKKLIEHHGIAEILNVYFEDNCYTDVLDCLTSHVSEKLERLAKIEGMIQAFCIKKGIPLK